MKILKYSEETGDIEEFEIDTQITEIESCDCEKNAGYNILIESCKLHNPIFQ